MRKFKIWNEEKTSSLDLDKDGIYIKSINGLGLNYNFESYTRTLNLEDLSITLIFETYEKYSNFVKMIKNKKAILEYKFPIDTDYITLFKNIELKKSTLTQKNEFKVLEETFNFKSLSELYKVVNYTLEANDTITVNNLKGAIGKLVWTKPTGSPVNFPILSLGSFKIQMNATGIEEPIVIDGFSKKIYSGNENLYKQLMLGAGYISFPYINSDEVNVYSSFDAVLEFRKNYYE